MRAVTTYHLGPATISDGEHECVLEVEIHTMEGRDAATPAWHVTIRGQLPHEMRFPDGKALSVVIEGGQRGVGTLVDPRLIRGVGEPPCTSRQVTATPRR